MKQKWLQRIPKCGCGLTYQKMTTSGIWYWCTKCDAVPHKFNCRRLDSAGNCQCGKPTKETE